MSLLKDKIITELNLDDYEVTPKSKLMITRKDVDNLREATGYGLLDCKNALLTTNGDFEVAANLLKHPMSKLDLQYCVMLMSEMLGKVETLVSNLEERVSDIEEALGIEE